MKTASLLLIILTLNYSLNVTAPSSQTDYEQWQLFDGYLRSQSCDEHIRNMLQSGKFNRIQSIRQGVLMTYMLQNGSQVSFVIQMVKNDDKQQILVYPQEKKVNNNTSSLLSPSISQPSKSQQSITFEQSKESFLSNQQIVNYIAKLHGTKLPKIDEIKFERKQIQEKQKQEYSLTFNPIQNVNALYEIICHSKRNGKEIQIASQGFIGLPVLQLDELRQISDQQMSKHYYKEFVDAFLDYYSKQQSDQAQLQDIKWSPPYVQVKLANQKININIQLIFDNVKKQIQIVKRLRSDKLNTQMNQNLTKKEAYNDKKMEDQQRQIHANADELKQYKWEQEFINQEQRLFNPIQKQQTKDQFLQNENQLTKYTDQSNLKTHIYNVQNAEPKFQAHISDASNAQIAKNESPLLQNQQQTEANNFIQKTIADSSNNPQIEQQTPGTKSQTTDSHASFSSSHPNLKLENDQNCIRFQSFKCVTCSYRFYLNQKGACQQIQAECDDYNVISGQCYKCYPGKILKNGICIQNDPFCLYIDNYSKKCSRCIKGFNIVQGKCKKKR